MVPSKANTGTSLPLASLGWKTWPLTWMLMGSTVMVIAPEAARAETPTEPTRAMVSIPATKGGRRFFMERTSFVFEESISHNLPADNRREAITIKQLPLITSAFLNVTNACNLRCRYCFVQQHPDYMTLQVAKDAADFLTRNAQQQGASPP